MAEKHYKLIDETTLQELIRNKFQQSYMILLLAHVCEKNKIDTTITLHDGCRILGLRAWDVLLALERNQGKCSLARGQRIFNAYDFALLSEQIQRRSVLKVLQSIPAFTPDIPATQPQFQPEPQL